MFNLFPVIQYPFDGSRKLTTDIFVRVAANSYLRNLSYLDTITIQEGETPEILSHLLYKTPHYHWTFFIINNMTDPRQDWPLNQNDLINYAIDKYGDLESIYETHHYCLESNPTVIVDEGTEGSIEVTNIDYETQINETKRTILAISPSQINNFLMEFNRLLK
jgi:hypothetical protein